MFGGGNSRVIDVLSEYDSDDNWYYDAIHNRVKVSLNFDSNRELQKTMLFVNILMGDEKDAYGIAGVGLNVSMLMEEFDKYKISKNSRLWLVDSLGRVQVSSEVNEINRPLDIGLSEGVLYRLLQSDSITVISNAVVGGQELELASMPVGNTNYRLLLLVPDKELFPVLTRIKYQTLLLSVVFLFLTLVVVRVLSRRIILSPVLRLKKQSKQWAEGRLHVDSDSYLLKREDEIGSLARSFEIMRSRLAENIAELNAMNDNLIEDKQQLKLVNDQLKEALEKASESERLTQSFLANISHEIRTPMNSIMGFSQLLQQSDLEDKERAYYLDIVLRSGSQLLNILDSIISLAKIESGVVKARSTKINLSELVRQSMDMYGFMAQEKGLELVCDLDGEKSEIEVMSDSAFVLMVLNNLISNAIKFTHVGKVEVTCFKEKGKAVILVKDTGIGITREDVGFIFDPFRQVETTHTIKAIGAGLGLAIVDKIMHILGGTIDVESTLDEGTVFRVELPDQN